MEIGGGEGIATKTDILKIETKIGDLKGEIIAVRGEITAVNGRIDSVRNELKGEIKEVRGQIQLLILLNVGIFLAVVGSIIASFLKT